MWSTSALRPLHMALMTPCLHCTYVVLTHGAGSHGMQTREEMAKNVMSGFQAYVSQENTDVMRSYLTNSYTSGSTEEGYKERRGYYRSKKDPKR
jgi:hypothetical protein